MPRKRKNEDSISATEVWEWNDSTDDNWKAFDDDAQNHISQAIKQKKNFVNLLLDGIGDIKITFKKMSAVVCGSKRVIDVRKSEASLKEAKVVKLTTTQSDVVSAVNGTKTNLNGEKNEKSNNVEVDADSHEVTISFVGKAPVDPECTEKLNKAQVYEENGVVWDCMLNQTNIGPNNNKFYNIQLLKDLDANIYSVWFRWGRVGKKGQTKLTNFFANLEGAKNLFRQKFKEKTSNAWDMKEKFSKVSGKYDLVLRVYNADVEETDDVLKDDPIEIPPSKLDEKLQSLIELICDIKSIEASLMEMKYDPKKAPLGRLSTEQINLGFAALKNIENIIEGTSKDSLAEACSLYYTRIPHDFGMRQPPLISTLKALEQEVQLLECLRDVHAAVKRFKEKSLTTNPIDKHYEQLECDLTPLEKDSETFKLLERYMQTTHAHTHDIYTLEVVDIFEVNKSKEKEGFKDYGNRMLLWHGSRLMNWAGILSQGLRIAPPEAPCTGYMFGKGVYFADASSKSANYCYTSKTKNIGILLLAEVSLGQTNDLFSANYNASKLPKGKNSTKGVGSMVPSEKNFVSLDDGVLIPMGPLEANNTSASRTCVLNYNEYIVYDTKQIRMRYLFKTKFHFKH